MLVFLFGRVFFAPPPLFFSLNQIQEGLGPVPQPPCLKKSADHWRGRGLSRTQPTASRGHKHGRGEPPSPPALAVEGLCHSEPRGLQEFRCLARVRPPLGSSTKTCRAQQQRATIKCSSDEVANSSSQHFF